MKFRQPDCLDKIELQMTPMIDIVFLLNIFFLFTFKIVLPEGDFNVQMPSAAASRAAEPSELPPLRLVMKAAPTGHPPHPHPARPPPGSGPADRSATAAMPSPSCKTTFAPRSWLRAAARRTRKWKSTPTI